MLNNKEYEILLKQIREMSEKDFLDFIDSPELTQEDKQLLFDRFGRNKRRWWDKNKTLTSLSLKTFKSEETLKRETRKSISILHDTKIKKMTSNLTDEKFGFEVWIKKSK